jgi:hypothetical protein
MRDQYAYEGLNRLDETLNATGVLSDEYRRVVFGWTLKAVTEAYEAGRREARAHAHRSRRRLSLRVALSEIQ